MCPRCIETNSGYNQSSRRQSDTVGSNHTTLEIMGNGGKKMFCEAWGDLTISGKCCLGNH